MNPERATLIADLCRTLDTYNRSRPWAPIILWHDDMQRACMNWARAVADLFGAMPVIRDRRDEHKHNLMRRYRPRRNEYCVSIPDVRELA